MKVYKKMKRQRGCFTEQDFYAVVDAGNLTYGEIVARFGRDAMFKYYGLYRTLLGMALVSQQAGLAIYLIQNDATAAINYCGFWKTDLVGFEYPLYCAVNESAVARWMEPVAFFLLLYGADPYQKEEDEEGLTAYDLADMRDLRTMDNATYSLGCFRAVLTCAWWTTQQVPELRDIGQPLLERLWYTAGFQRI